MKNTSETKGILVSVYKSPLGDSTNGGLSSKKDSLIMVDKDGSNFDCPHTTEEDYLVLQEKKYFVGTPKETTVLRAVPKSLIDEGRWVMFGGNFCYTSDDRFPSNAPIKIFDRVED